MGIFLFIFYRVFYYEISLNVCPSVRYTTLNKIKLYYVYIKHLIIAFKQLSRIVSADFDELVNENKQRRSVYTYKSLNAVQAGL